MVKDLWPDPRSLTIINGVLYFTASDGAAGREIWQSDGTTAGTYMLKDILPGDGSACEYDLWGMSEPVSPEFTDVQGTTFFVANGGSGRELWKTDGTESGTALVADLRPGTEQGGAWHTLPASSWPIGLTGNGHSLFFAANDGVHGLELWRVSDGNPHVKLGGVPNVDEGTEFARSGSFFDLDGSSWNALVDYGDGSGTQPLALSLDKSFHLQHRYDDNTSYTVSVTVVNNFGGIGTAETTAVVSNVAPTASISQSGTGRTRTLFLSAAYPSLADQDAGFTYRVDWGDGRTEEVQRTPRNGAGISLDHTYTQTGTYTVTVAAQDKDGDYGVDATCLVDVQVDASNISTQLTDVVAAAVQSNPAAPEVVLCVDSDGGLDAMISAADPGNLAPPTTPVILVLNLAPLEPEEPPYTLGSVSLAGNVTLVINGLEDDAVTFVGGSPSAGA